MNVCLPFLYHFINLPRARLNWLVDVRRLFVGNHVKNHNISNLQLFPAWIIANENGVPYAR